MLVFQLGHFVAKSFAHFLYNTIMGVAKWGRDLRWLSLFCENVKWERFSPFLIESPPPGALSHHNAKTYTFRYFRYGKFTILIPPALRFYILFCKCHHFQRGRQSKYCFHHYLKRVCQKTMEMTTGNWNKVCHLQHIPTYVRIIDGNTIMYLRFLTADTSLLLVSSLRGFTSSPSLSSSLLSTTGVSVEAVSYL